MSDLSLALIIIAPLLGGYGMYMVMEAIATKSYALGFIGSLVTLVGGLGIGKLLWGGVML